MRGTRRLADLAAAGLVNDQAVTLVVESDIFEPARTIVETALPPAFTDLVTCRLCAGMWIAIGQAAAGMFDWHPPIDTRKPSWFPQVRRSRLAVFIVRALAIAAAGRLSHNLTRDYLHPYEPDA